ncbi:F-box protein At4g09920-like [Typha latifolia]|uniref:F-box protein At4g09920-like n=1 Tax=Typha latifolia TaxID=4733 RepID=UPI003C3030E6
MVCMNTMATSPGLKRQNMGRAQDRISSLPDDILHSILSMVPLKSAIRTSALSRRWRSLYEHCIIFATVLDFGEEFSCSQSPEQFATTVNRYLPLHGDGKLEKFRILFSPFDLFMPDIESWISFAVSKGVKVLDLDLSQGITHNGIYIDERWPFKLPNCLFQCNSLTHLYLSRCEFTGPIDLRCFQGLRELSLSYIEFTDEMLQIILLNSPFLESLILRNCALLVDIKISGPDIRLRSLTLVGCLPSTELEISAPNLQSLILYGRLSAPYHFNNISALVDAHICSTIRVTDNDYVTLLTDLAHVKILTLSSAALMDLALATEYDDDEYFPIQLQNLQELQLAMDSISEEHLTCIFAFFEHCPSPFLEKLFIQLMVDMEDPIGVADTVTITKIAPDVAFSHLKLIKISNFRGSITELRLVKFLLGNAIVLESLVLVASQASDHTKRCDDSLAMRILRGQLSLIPKASAEACIVLHEFFEDDCNLNPTHRIVCRENGVQTFDWA